jgi:hypothetical protein
MDGDSKPCVLVAADPQEFADCLAEALQEVTDEYDVDSVCSIESARERLADRHFRWLIISERLPEGGKGSTLTGRPNGAVFAQEYLNDSSHPDLQAIVLTENTWPHLDWKFDVRLIGIPKASPALNEPHLLVDMMHAGEAGSIFAPPTTITLEIWAGDPGTMAVLSVDDGPLQKDIGDIVRDRLRPRTVTVEGDVESGVAAFRSTIDADATVRSEALKDFAHRLCDALKPPGAFARLLDDVRKLAVRMFKAEALNRVDLSLVHLHIRCEPEMLALPLDLALPKFTGFPHLCNLLPVSWRIRWDGRENNDVVRRFNPTNYRHFRAVYSCCDPVRLNGLRPFSALAEAPGAVRAIADVLGVGADCAMHISDGPSCQRALGASHSNGEGQCAYVLTHGLHGQPADRTGFVVGPRPGTQEADWVTAEHLIPQPEAGARRFFYFNCCELGAQETDANSKGSYVGSFLQGLLYHGVCAEAICNRWSVNFEWASFMATEFYRHKPRTAQGRTSALFFARRRTRQAMNRRFDATQNDISWLAPVHVWGW